MKPELTISLPPESAARVAEMRGHIADAQTALVRLVQVVCVGTPPEVQEASERLQAAAWQLGQIRRALEPRIRQEYELFAVPRVVIDCDDGDGCTFAERYGVTP